MQKTKKQPERILSRKLAKTLTTEQLRAIAGGAGTTSCSPCADDSDPAEA
jgi:hypothetical protein